MARGPDVSDPCSCCGACYIYMQASAEEDEIIHRPTSDEDTDGKGRTRCAAGPAKITYTCVFAEIRAWLPFAI